MRWVHFGAGPRKRGVLVSESATLPLVLWTRPTTTATTTTITNARRVGVQGTESMVGLGGWASPAPLSGDTAPYAKGAALGAVPRKS